MRRSMTIPSGSIWLKQIDAAELFLPSYVDHDTHDLEQRPDPVEEIRLTDEEAAAIMPR